MLLIDAEGEVETAAREDESGGREKDEGMLSITMLVGGPYWLEVVEKRAFRIAQARVV